MKNSYVRERTLASLFANRLGISFCVYFFFMATPLPANLHLKPIEVPLRRRKNLLPFNGSASVFQPANNSPLQVPAPHNGNGAHADGLLTSWKDISAYLDRGVRTVQRWEQMLGLPVHRIGTGNRAPVFALKNEIDSWLRRNAGAPPTTHVARQQLNSRQHQLMQVVQEFRECALQLERAVIADGSGPDERVIGTLITIQKLVNGALKQLT